MHELEQIRPRVALDVVFDVPLAISKRCRDFANVLRRDVPSIAPGMRGYAGRAGRDTHVDGFENARHASAARITERRHFVDVNGKMDHEDG